MRGLLGGLVGPREETPLSKAQDLMHEAFESHDPIERVELAKKALELCPDCADAYVLLAEHTKNRKEALDLFENGVAAGERALGPEAFRDDVRALLGPDRDPSLHACPRGAGEHPLDDGASGRSNRSPPGHAAPQSQRQSGGVRDTLAGVALLAEERDEELARLFEQYDEETTHWAYSKTLVAFRQHGDTPESRRLLQRARKANQHVPAYLLGQKPLPLERPGWYSPGDRNEAILYAGERPERLEGDARGDRLLKATEQTTKRSKDPNSVTQGPTSPVKEWLQHLSQGFDVWQADFRLTPHWIKIGGEPVRPWVVLITSRSDDLVPRMPPSTTSA